MVSVRNLIKKYDRGARAIDLLSFEVRRGEIVGLVGSNGAGKTTALRILATLLLPTSGSIEICGGDICKNPEWIRRQIGHVPEIIGFYKRFTAIWNLKFYAACYGKAFNDDQQSLLPLLERLSLVPYLHIQVGKFSKGMMQKLALVRALLHDPQVVLLDEPLEGLDVLSRVEFKDILKELSARGKAILLSTHILKDVYDLCDRILILEEGRKLLDKSIQAIRRESAVEEGEVDLERYYLRIIGRKDAK